MNPDHAAMTPEDAALVPRNASIAELEGLLRRLMETGTGGEWPESASEAWDKAVADASAALPENRTVTKETT